MITPPPEVIAAARLVTQWAAENNLQQFAIYGIQNRVFGDSPHEARSDVEISTSRHTNSAILICGA